ncbi:MAG: DUF3006 domain-containing protein [Patescibacteria group bacterium]
MTASNGIEQYSVPAVIDRFEGMAAVVRVEGGQELKWPVKKLPNHAKEGTVVRLTLSTTASEEVEREQLAKAILNELLKRTE